jgi:carboxyl-terminal processing protease
VLREPFDTSIKESLIWVDKNTAAIKINSFDLSYKSDNVTQLMTQAAKAKNLLVDLRGNGGGAVTNMMQFLSTILPQGTVIGTFIDKRSVDNFVTLHAGDRNDLKGIAEYSVGNQLKVPASDIPVFTGHIAVLVDPGSGSASEITAEALKEIKNAPIVGEKSAGAVLVSVMGDLGHKFNLQYPISDYISLNGVRLEANGIVPTQHVTTIPFLKKGQIDPAYVTAEEVLDKSAQSIGG